MLITVWDILAVRMPNLINAIYIFMEVLLYLSVVLCKAYVQSVVVYGSETLPLKVKDLKRLKRTERSIMSGMCGLPLKNRIKNEELQ